MDMECATPDPKKQPYVTASQVEVDDDLDADGRNVKLSPFSTDSLRES